MSQQPTIESCESRGKNNDIDYRLDPMSNSNKLLCVRRCKRHVKSTAVQSKCTLNKKVSATDFDGERRDVGALLLSGIQHSGSREMEA